MRCLATHIGAVFHDEDDVRYLLRHMDVGIADRVRAIIGRYYPIEPFPQKTPYALAEMLPRKRQRADAG